VQRRLSQTKAVLGRVTPRGWVPVSGMKVQSLVGLSNHTALHWWSAQSTARMLLLSDELMSCCVVGTNGCLDLRYGWALNRTDVQAPWHSVLRDSVVPLWRNYRMRMKCKSSQPWLSESIVTQRVKPHAGAGCWRHERCPKTSLRFVIALFANLGDLDEICNWVSANGIRHFVNRNY